MHGAGSALGVDRGAEPGFGMGQLPAGDVDHAPGGEVFGDLGGDPGAVGDAAEYAGAMQAVGEGDGRRGVQSGAEAFGGELAGQDAGRLARRVAARAVRGDATAVRPSMSATRRVSPIWCRFMRAIVPPERKCGAMFVALADKPLCNTKRAGTPHEHAAR